MKAKRIAVDWFDPAAVVVAGESAGAGASSPSSTSVRLRSSSLKSSSSSRLRSQVAQLTLSQAQQAYAAITGGRANAAAALWNQSQLPAGWTQLLGVQNGAGIRHLWGVGERCGRDDPARNVALDAGHYSQNFSAGENAQLNAPVARAVALQEALALGEELANVSQPLLPRSRRLISAIPAATDEKGILDLQARIQVEQGMLQNENLEASTCSMQRPSRE